MSDEFIPYEEALALKELGFDEKCITKWDLFYLKERLYPVLATLHFGTHEKEVNGYDQAKVNEGGYSFTGYKNSVLDHGNEVVSAPLYQQAFRWFRENHKLVAEIQAPDGLNGVWHPTIHKVHGFGNHYNNDGFATYEEAELACLRKLIELLGDSPDKGSNSTNANSDNTNG